MNRRTPTTHHDAHSHLRVLEGVLAAGSRQEDDPADEFDEFRLEAELAAAARLCDELEQDGLQITFDRDPAGGRVRVRVVDAAGRAAGELALADVVSPAHLRLTGASS